MRQYAFHSGSGRRGSGSSAMSSRVIDSLPASRWPSGTSSTRQFSRLFRRAYGITSATTAAPSRKAPSGDQELAQIASSRHADLTHHRL
jgi:hypothetical protein